MKKRSIIKIDNQKCNGCSQCIPNCPEGAIQIIDGKARLVSDLFCDGLGACLGHCPEGAITIEERLAEDYNESKVMANIVKEGENVIKAHLKHLKDHKADKYLEEALDYLKEKGIQVELKKETTKKSPCACPGAKVMELKKRDSSKSQKSDIDSELRQWPAQLMLVPAVAPFLNDCDLLIAADCTAFSYGNFHQDLLKGKMLLVGCPKLDDLEVYADKISQILEFNEIKSITYARMEVPCCAGLGHVIKQAINNSNKNVPYEEVVISINGERLS